jgi:hypothetical protein
MRATESTAMTPQRGCHIDPQLPAVLKAQLHSGFDHEALSVAGVSRLKLRLKASCLGTSSQFSTTARLSDSDVTTPRYGNRRPRRFFCFKPFDADIDP